MLFSGIYHSSSDEILSDEEASLSAISNATSKSTTTDSWHDVKSDIEQPLQIIKEMDQVKGTDLNEQTLEEEDKALVRSINDLYISDGNIEIETITVIERVVQEVPVRDNRQQKTIVKPIKSSSHDNSRSTTPMKELLNEDDMNDSESSR